MNTGEENMGEVEDQPLVQTLFEDDDPNLQQSPGETDEAGKEAGGEGGKPQEKQETEDERIERLAKEVAGRQQSAPSNQPQQQKQYSDEELKKIFKVWEPNQEFVEKILNGGEDALAAMVEMRDKLSEQNGAFVQYLLQSELAKLRAEFAPARQVAQEQRVQQFYKDFGERYPDLQGREKVVGIAFERLKASGFKGKDLNEVYERLAGDTRTLLKELGVSANGQNANGATQQKQPRLTPLGRGSQGGVGGGGSPAASNPVKELFSD